MTVTRFEHTRAALKGRRVLTVGEVERLAAAVQWHLTKRPDRWGPVRDGAEAWAVNTGSAAIVAIVGRMSSGIIEAMGRAVEELDETERFRVIVYATRAEAEAARRDDTIDAAFRWPWDTEPGAELCRVNAAVLEEAAGIAPMWEWLSKAREVLKANDSAGAWDDEDDGRPAPVFRVLVDALAWAWDRQKKRLAKMPEPTVHPVAVALASTLKKGGDFRAAASSLALDGRARGAEAMASLIMPSELTLSDADAPKAMMLIAVLARRVHSQWSSWDPAYERVKIAISELIAAGIIYAYSGRAAGRDAETQALDLFNALASVGVRGLGHLVVPGSVHVVDDKGEVGRERGGRPARYVVARLGDALAPYGVLDWYQRENLKAPDGLRFWAAAFNPEWAPTVGNRQTLARQRAAYAVGVTAWLMAHRYEYAAGGVPVETLGDVLEGFGLYVRSHASLVSNVIDAFMTPPKQPALGGPSSALLVPVKGRPGLVTLGDGHREYRAFHAQILNAAEIGEKSRKRVALAKARKSVKRS